MRWQAPRPRGPSRTSRSPSLQARSAHRLLVAPHQRGHIFPAPRIGDSLERVMHSLAGPTPPVRVPEPADELRQIGTPLCFAQPFAEHVTRNMTTWMASAREQIYGRASDLSLGSSEFVHRCCGHRGDPLDWLLVVLRAGSLGERQCRVPRSSERHAYRQRQPSGLGTALSISARLRRVVQKLVTLSRVALPQSPACYDLVLWLAYCPDTRGA